MKGNVIYPQTLKFVVVTLWSLDEFSQW